MLKGDIGCTSQKRLGIIKSMSSCGSSVKPYSRRQAPPGDRFHRTQPQKASREKRYYLTPDHLASHSASTSGAPGPSLFMPVSVRYRFPSSVTTSTRWRRIWMPASEG